MLCGPPPHLSPAKEYHLNTLICQDSNKIMLTLSILVWEFSKRLQLIQARKQTPNCNVKIPQTEAKGIILRTDRLQSKLCTEQTTDHKMLVYSHYLK